MLLNKQQVKILTLVIFFLLSKSFIESFDTQSKDNVYTYTDDKEDSESENIIDTTERYNYNNSYEPLNNDEIQSLIDDLRNRQQDTISDAGKKYSLKHLGMSFNRSGMNIMVGTQDKKVHFLLSRLYKTNKQCFRMRKDGSIYLANTSTKKLIHKLESLKSFN